MRALPNDCIDLVVTSPPYDNLRTYAGCSWNFPQTAYELFRILKVGGVVVWVVGDATIDGSETGTSFKQALYLKDMGFNLYDTMVYAKQNPAPNNHRRYTQQFEYMFVLSKGKPRTFNPILAPCVKAGQINAGTMRNNHSDQLSKKHGSGKPYKDYKIHGNIFTYCVGNIHNTNTMHHPAVFPEQLACDQILSWSNKGDIVFDPFMGSGTTASAALFNQRFYLGFDTSSEYVEGANARLLSVERKSYDKTDV